MEVVVVAFDFEDAFSDVGRALATITAAAWSEFDGLGLGSGEEICENKVAVIIIAAAGAEEDEIKRDSNYEYLNSQLRGNTITDYCCMLQVARQC